MTRALVVLGLTLTAAGCMTVPGGLPSPHASPDPAPGPTHAPGPADTEEPPLPVQAPAKEALSQLPGPGAGLTSGAPREAHAAAPGPGNGTGAVGAPAQQPPGEAQARRSAPPTPPRKVQESTGDKQLPVRIRLPATGRTGASATGLCELGETYGRWDRRSDQARICRAAYGN